MLERLLSADTVDEKDTTVSMRRLVKMMSRLERMMLKNVPDSPMENDETSS